VNYVECFDNPDSDGEQETVASTEWIQNNKKSVMCSFGKGSVGSIPLQFLEKELESFGFDITKANKIFDLWLSKGLIKLKPYHKIPF
jgi:hypothetical protein